MAGQELARITHKLSDKDRGDYVLKDKDLTKAYLYSTQINLQDYVGKKVTVLVTPRSNNNFAFPAYFVLSVE